MKDPAILFYTSDFLTGCSDLTMEERGQYITMLCLQHQKGRLSPRTIALSIPNASEYVLAKFDIDEEGNYYNKRLEMEISKREAYAQSRRENGLKGGRPKKTEEKPYAYEKETICESIQEPTEKHTENENKDIDIDINDLVNRVIEYLNLKCKTRYKANTNDVKKHLIARINEGYTYDDFVKVIDIKYAEWKGTEFEKFLRPSTLFGTKFQSYLNQPVKETAYGDADDFFNRAVAKTYEEDEEDE